MISTDLTRALNIEHPVVQGPLGGPWDPSTELVAAVNECRLS